ncbi:MAG: MogA/MoaB family molybdenum cofactor biosynthesis protein [Firmicutes bacterium]|nr:MogA/MoaB family molybdenum cofactor biosynthesis protein [Bacillota bacterium]MBE3590883.1 MogA/MoaB family molybdenum cofactor biosynthesis protein [Bacillota bacterium]
MAEAPATGPEGHRRAAEAQVGTVRAAVLTISDTRTEETDTAGRWIRERLAAAGHAVAAHRIVRDDPETVAEAVAGWLASPDVDVILTTGGTGIARRDRTVEAVRPLLEREIPGFGEIFRWLSYQEIGAAAMLSGAFAGTARGKLVACLPGSRGAVELALERLLLPELRHLVWELRR